MLHDLPTPIKNILNSLEDQNFEVNDVLVSSRQGTIKLHVSNLTSDPVFRFEVSRPNHETRSHKTLIAALISLYS